MKCCQVLATKRLWKFFCYKLPCEEGCEFRFPGDLYSQESTFPLVIVVINTALRQLLFIVGIRRSSYIWWLLAAYTRANDGRRDTVSGVCCGRASYHGEPSADGSQATHHCLQLYPCRHIGIHVLGGETHVGCLLNKGKDAHTRLPSVGFLSWSRFLAVSLQMTWVVNLVVGCHCFLPGPQLPPATLKRAATKSYVYPKIDLR